MTPGSSLVHCCGYNCKTKSKQATRFFSDGLKQQGMFGSPLALVASAAGARRRRDGGRRKQPQPDRFRSSGRARQRVNAGLAVAHHERGAATW